MNPNQFKKVKNKNRQNRVRFKKSGSIETSKAPESPTSDYESPSAGPGSRDSSPGPPSSCSSPARLSPPSPASKSPTRAHRAIPSHWDTTFFKTISACVKILANKTQNLDTFFEPKYPRRHYLSIYSNNNHEIKKKDVTCSCVRSPTTQSLDSKCNSPERKLSPIKSVSTSPRLSSRGSDAPSLERTSPLPESSPVLEYLPYIKELPTLPTRTKSPAKTNGTQNISKNKTRSAYSTPLEFKRKPISTASVPYKSCLKNKPVYLSPPTKIILKPPLPKGIFTKKPLKTNRATLKLLKYKPYGPRLQRSVKMTKKKQRSEMINRKLKTNSSFRKYNKDIDVLYMTEFIEKIKTSFNCDAVQCPALQERHERHCQRFHSDTRPPPTALAPRDRIVENTTQTKLTLDKFRKLAKHQNVEDSERKQPYNFSIEERSRKILFGAPGADEINEEKLDTEKIIQDFFNFLRNANVDLDGGDYERVLNNALDMYLKNRQIQYPEKSKRQDPKDELREKLFNTLMKERKLYKPYKKTAPSDLKNFSFEGLDLEKEVNNWLNKCTFLPKENTQLKKQIAEALVTRLSPYLGQPSHLLNKGVLKGKIMIILRDFGIHSDVATAGTKPVIAKFASDLANRVIGVVTRWECSQQWLCSVIPKTPNTDYLDEGPLSSNQKDKTDFLRDKNEINLSSTLTIYTSENDLSFNPTMGLSTPRKKKEVQRLNPKEVDYTEKIAHVIWCWIQELPAYFKFRQDMINFMIHDIAGEIVDQTRVGQIVAQTYNRERFITVYIYKWLLKYGAIDEEEIEKSEPFVIEVAKRIVQLTEPDLKRPQHGTRHDIKLIKHGMLEKYTEPFHADVKDLLEDEISIFLNEYPSDIYVEKNKSALNDIIHQFAEKIQPIIDEKDKDKQISKEIRRWLHIVVKPKERDQVDRMANSLTERLKKLPTDETISEYVKSVREQRERKAAQKFDPDENIGTSHEYSQNVSQDDKNDTMKEFIANYIEESNKEQDPLVKKVYLELLKSELYRLSPESLANVYEKKSYDKFSSEKLKKELEYITDISEWLLCLPLDSFFNTVENKERPELIISLAKNVAELEEERQQTPDAMDYDSFLSGIIIQFIGLLPILPQYNSGVNIKPMYEDLLRRLAIRRGDIQTTSAGQGIVNFLNDFMQQHGQEIADDKLKLAAWSARVVKEFENILRQETNIDNLTKQKIVERLTHVPIPGDQSAKHFDLELKYAKEIVAIINEIELQNPVEETVISELAEKMADHEIQRPDNHIALENYVHDWVNRLFFFNKNEVNVPEITQKIVSKIKTVTEETHLQDGSAILPVDHTSVKPNTDKLHDASPVKAKCRGCCPVSDPQQILVNAISKWCDSYPLKQTAETSHLKEELKHVLLYLIKLIESEPTYANNNILFEKCLTGEVNNLFKHKKFDIFNNDPLNKQLIMQIVQARDFIKDLTAGETYRKKLENEIEKSLPETSTAYSDSEVELFKQIMTDKFILDNFDHGKDEAKLYYLKNIQKKIDKVAESIQAHCHYPLDKEKLCNDIYSALYSVEIPNEEAVVDDVEEIKTKYEIEGWFNNLPFIIATDESDVLDRNTKFMNLSKKIHDYEQQNAPPKIIHEEIKKTLHELQIQAEHQPNFDSYADILQVKLLNTEKSRKCTKSTPETKKSNQSDENIIKEITKHVEVSKENTKSYPNPADKVIEIVEHWCDNLPLVNLPQDQLKLMKDDITTKVLIKLSELNSCPSTFHSKMLYNHLLRQEIDKILTELPANDTLAETKDFLIKGLITEIESVRPLFINEKLRQKYRKEVEDTVTNIIEAPRKPSPKNKADLDEVEEELIHDFVEYQYNKDDEKIKQHYKEKIVETLTNYNTQDASPQGIKNAQADSLIEANRLLCELSKLDEPNDEVIREEIEEIRMNKEVNKFFNEVKKVINKQRVTRQLKKSLANQLNDIEKAGHNPESEKQMTDAVVRTLKKINAEHSVPKSDIISFIVRLRKNEALRKAPPFRKQKQTDTRRLSLPGKLSDDPNRIFGDQLNTSLPDRLSQTVTDLVNRNMEQEKKMMSQNISQGPSMYPQTRMYPPEAQIPYLQAQAMQPLTQTPTLPGSVPLKRPDPRRASLPPLVTDKDYLLFKDQLNASLPGALSHPRTDFHRPLPQTQIPYPQAQPQMPYPSAQIPYLEAQGMSPQTQRTSPEAQIPYAEDQIIPPQAQSPQDQFPTRTQAQIGPRRASIPLRIPDENLLLEEFLRTSMPRNLTPQVADTRKFFAQLKMPQTQTQVPYSEDQPPQIQTTVPQAQIPYPEPQIIPPQAQRLFPQPQVPYRTQTQHDQSWASLPSRVPEEYKYIVQDRLHTSVPDTLSQVQRRPPQPQMPLQRDRAMVPETQIPFTQGQVTFRQPKQIPPRRGSVPSRFPDDEHYILRDQLYTSLPGSMAGADTIRPFLKAQMQYPQAQIIPPQTEIPMPQPQMLSKLTDQQYPQAQMPYSQEPTQTGRPPQMPYPQAQPQMPYPSAQIPYPEGQSMSPQTKTEAQIIPPQAQSPQAQSPTRAQKQIGPRRASMPLRIPEENLLLEEFLRTSMPRNLTPQVADTRKFFAQFKKPQTQTQVPYSEDQSPQAQTTVPQAQIPYPEPQTQAEIMPPQTEMLIPQAQVLPKPAQIPYPEGQSMSPQTQTEAQIIPPQAQSLQAQSPTRTQTQIGPRRASIPLRIPEENLLLEEFLRTSMPRNLTPQVADTRKYFAQFKKPQTQTQVPYSEDQSPQAQTTVPQAQIPQTQAEIMPPQTEMLIPQAQVLPKPTEKQFAQAPMQQAKSQMPQMETISKQPEKKFHQATSIAPQSHEATTSDKSQVQQKLDASQVKSPKASAKFAQTQTAQQKISTQIPQTTASPKSRIPRPQTQIPSRRASLPTRLQEDDKDMFKDKFNTSMPGALTQQSTGTQTQPASLRTANKASSAPSSSDYEPPSSGDADQTFNQRFGGLAENVNQISGPGFTSGPPNYRGEEVHTQTEYGSKKKVECINDFEDMDCLCDYIAMQRRPCFNLLNDYPPMFNPMLPYMFHRYMF